MGRRERAVVGGLLTGIGEGMQQSAADRRADAEAARERAHELARDRERYQAQADRDEANRGLLAGTEVSATGEIVGFTRGGDTVNTGVMARPRASETASSGLSAGDQRIIDNAIAMNTKSDSYTGQETTDWAAVAAQLTNQGRPELARMFERPEGAGSQTIDVNSAEYAEAARMADEWVKEQAGTFSRDSSDFAEYGGNRAEARRQKTLEFYAELTGQTPAGGGGGGGGGGGPAANAPAGLSGSGTEADPYMATTQEQIDWVRDNAPAGTVINVNGQLYRK